MVGFLVCFDWRYHSERYRIPSMETAEKPKTKLMRMNSLFYNTFSHVLKCDLFLI